MQTNRWAVIPLPPGTGFPVQVQTQEPTRTPDRSAATGKIAVLARFRNRPAK